MIFRELEIAGIVLVEPRRIGDARGHFMESFRKDLFESHCGAHDFVQENQSLSAEAGTVRGLHFQIDPQAQGKLVSCIAGALLDVVVDIRPESPSFGRHLCVELTEENARQLWIPAGFAHGFCTLAPATKISYKVTSYYSREHERGIAWDDPALAIEWPVDGGRAVLSEKDRALPPLEALN